MTIGNKDIPKNWLITGGCGFIGTALIRQLVKNENVKQIRILDNLSVGSKSDLSNVCNFENYYELKEEGIFLKVGDILDQNLCIEVSKKVDCIVHLAANTGVPQSVDAPRRDMEINVIGTFNMLEASRINGIKQFIFASSGASVGEVEPPIHEEIPPHPVSPYGSSKLAGEGYCSSYAKTFGINTVILRFGNVYGPGSTHKNSVVAKFIRQALNYETLEIYGDGAQTRDFIYINDLINAVMLSTTKDNIGGEVFQIATNKETTVGEMTKQLVNTMQVHGIEGIKVINGETRLGDVKRNYSDTTKAKTRLSWQPTVTLEEGLKNTVKYFIQ